MGSHVSTVSSAAQILTAESVDFSYLAENLKKEHSRFSPLRRHNVVNSCGENLQQLQNQDSTRIVYFSAGFRSPVSCI